MRNARALMFTAFGLVAGYLIGGWVYEVAGHGVWRGLIEWQTLIAAAVAGVAAVAAWSAIQGQIKEMRRQFRRQMMFATARDRASIDWMTKSPGADIKFLLDLIDRATPLIQTQQFQIASKYWPNFEQVRESLQQWLQDQRYAPATGHLTGPERDAIQQLIYGLTVVGSEQANVNDGSVTSLEVLRNIAEEAKDAVEALRKRAESWVPPAN